MILREKKNKNKRVPTEKNLCPVDFRGAAIYNEQLEITIHKDVQCRPIENIESYA